MNCNERRFARVIAEQMARIIELEELLSRAEDTIKGMADGGRVDLKR